MANAKIKAGLAKHEASKLGLPAPKFAHLAGRRLGLADLKNLRNTIGLAHHRLRRLREATVTALASQKEAITAEHKDIGWVPGEREGQKIDTIGEQARRKLIDAALTKAKKATVALVEKEVNDNLLVLNETKAALKDGRAAWAHPIGVLNEMTVASPERSLYTENLSNSLAHELGAMARLAARNGDKPLASAVISRVLRMKDRKSLDFTNDQLAESMVYVEQRAATELLALSELAILAGTQEGREALGQQLNAGDRLALGNKSEQVAKELGRPLEAADLSTLVAPVTKAPENAATKAIENAEKQQADERSEDFDRWLKMEPNTKEWTELGLRYGWVEEQGDENNDGD